MGYETAIRIGFFFGVFVLMALWEKFAQKRELIDSKKTRWFRNLSLIFLNQLTLRLVFPVLAVGVAFEAQKSGWGLLNHYSMPKLPAVIIGVTGLDFVIYFQHIMFHAVPVLWRLHMVHHADLDFDVTTGLRFHPLEILLSMVIKMGAVVALGPPPLAVLIFEVTLNASAMFNHGNIRIPAAADRIARLLVITPDMHRVHHSVFPSETNTNFGFFLPWWDRLCGTYKDQPSEGHQAMTIGLRPFQDVGVQTLLWMLYLPIKGKMGHYPLGHRGGKE